MNRSSTRQQAFTLKYSLSVAGGLSELHCPSCKGPIDTHQPDPDHPERILGTCSKCGTWFLVEPNGSGERFLILQLPDTGQIAPPPDFGARA